MIDVFFQSVTQARLENENLSFPNRVEPKTFRLPVPMLFH